MATRSLFKSHSNLTSRFLRNPFHLPTPIAQTTIIDEVLRLPLDQKSQSPHSAFSLADFLRPNQKLFTAEEGFLGARECLQTDGSALGGALWARGRGGSSPPPKRIDSGEEFDGDDVDDFDDDDLDDQDFDGEFSEDFVDDGEEEEEEEKSDNKLRRRK